MIYEKIHKIGYNFQRSIFLLILYNMLFLLMICSYHYEWKFINMYSKHIIFSLHKIINLFCWIFSSERSDYLAYKSDLESRNSKFKPKNLFPKKWLLRVGEYKRSGVESEYVFKFYNPIIVCMLLRSRVFKKRKRSENKHHSQKDYLKEYIEVSLN